MRKVIRYSVFFTLGGLGYGVIELLWRGRTHWTMIIAGGICFTLFSLTAEKLKRRPLPLKCVICAASVTAVEFVFGVIFNIFLDMKIWDYSRQPLNILGQICPLYTVLWGLLALLFVPLADILNRRL